MLRRLFLLISLPLSLAAFDSRTVRAREAMHAHGEDVVRKKKRILRKRSKVIPPWVRSRGAPVRMKVNHFANRSKDPLDSDQRKIRRKFNNM